MGGMTRTEGARAMPAGQEPRIEIVGIAASVGGPPALATLLADLPHTVPVPILVVQHIAGGFEQGLAEMLGRTSPLNVRVAARGHVAMPGEVIVAVPDLHLGVTYSGRVVLDAADAVDGHRPSATYLFRSIARSYGPRALGVVLTGMGEDGASGLLELHRAGGRVLAQDRQTSIVYGMPGAAASAGAVDASLPLPELATAIIDALRAGREETG
jgi:two-component system, chemotaxis family, protein-glutamate methylesterase/glutaminase